MAKKKQLRRKKPGGRPRVFGEASLRRAAIKHIQEGCTLTEAANLCGCGYETLNNAVKADESFRKQVAAAKIKRRASWKKTINRSARKDWRAAAFLLACEEAGSFRPNRPVHNTNIEQPDVNVQVVNVGETVQTALKNHPDFLEFLRRRALESDGHEQKGIPGGGSELGSNGNVNDGPGPTSADSDAGAIRQGSQQGPLGSRATPRLPGPGHNGHHNGNGRHPPTPGDDAAETRKE